MNLLKSLPRCLPGVTASACALTQRNPPPPPDFCPSDCSGVAS